MPTPTRTAMAGIATSNQAARGDRGRTSSVGMFSSDAVWLKVVALGAVPTASGRTRVLPARESAFDREEALLESTGSGGNGSSSSAAAASGNPLGGWITDRNLAAVTPRSC